MRQHRMPAQQALKRIRRLKRNQRPLVAISLLIALSSLVGCRDKEPASGQQDSRQNPSIMRLDTTAPDSTPNPQATTCGIPTAIGRYTAALEAWKAGQHPSSMAELWKIAASASDTLMTNLDCLTESDYHLAESSFVGFVVSREEQYLSDPNYEFFQGQADSFGTESDRTFYAFAKANMYRKHSWVWEEQFSDAGWCTRLSSPEIVNGYFAAETLMNSKAPEYRWWLEPRLRWVDTSLFRSNCVCDTRNEAIQGLSRSIARLPQGHPLRASLEATLAAVRRKEDGTRYSCHTE